MTETQGLAPDAWPAVEAIYTEGIATGRTCRATAWSRSQTERSWAGASAGCDRRYSPVQRRNATHALWPPKPNEFETPISTCCGRASFGM